LSASSWISSEALRAAGKQGPPGVQILQTSFPCDTHGALEARPSAAYDFARRIPMVIGDKLKSLRAQKKVSQGDMEKRTGLLRCYISRVENGHTVPSVETLERLAQALEVPMYRLFTDDGRVEKPDVPLESISQRSAHSKHEREIGAFARIFSRMNDKYRGLIFQMASKMASRA
jgi:transcriptional regulator with XRE-family HTH domain